MRIHMKQKFMRFMYGRYGNDRFNQFLIIFAFIFLILSLFTSNFFYVIALGVMIYAYYRMFSKKIYKRAAENQLYLKKELKVKAFINQKKKEIALSKTYHIYKCPNCKQKIRVPRGKGKIAIKCQKCSQEFIKKS